VSTVLCIDTASSAFALAFAVDGDVIGSMARDAGQDHSRRLLQAIDELLGERRHDLSGIAVVTGPGSYAGLRVGIATAEGLALARGVPITGIGTMEAIAHAAGLDSGTVVHPAGRGQYAIQEFDGGAPAGELGSAPGTELQGRRVTGESAEQFGGREVSPAQRCEAALRLALERLEVQAEHGQVDAVYLHEPHITVPRRQSKVQALPRRNA
jgi:tRNA threonylcarbamoyl adenosine modification protein YeaZ